MFEDVFSRFLTIIAHCYRATGCSSW